MLFPRRYTKRRAKHTEDGKPLWLFLLESLIALPPFDIGVPERETLGRDS